MNLKINSRAEEVVVADGVYQQRHLMTSEGNANERLRIRLMCGVKFMTVSLGHVLPSVSNNDEMLGIHLICYWRALRAKSCWMRRIR